MKQLFNDIKKNLKLFDKGYQKVGVLLAIPFLVPFYCILNTDKVSNCAVIVNIIILWIIFLIALFI